MGLFKKKEQTETKPKSKVKSIISWVLTGVFGVLFVLALGIQIVGWTSKSSNYGVPNFNGFQTNVVLTDSMEPDYKVGTLLFVQKTDPSKLEVGDDVTFYYSSWSSIVTHRIREIQINDGVDVGNGRYTLIVGGINEHSKSSPDVDPVTGGNCLEQQQIITEKYVLGKVVGSSVLLGGVYKFATSIWGLVVLLLIPTLYIVVTTIIDVVKELKNGDKQVAVATEGVNIKNNNSSNDSLKNLSDEDIKRLKEQMLKELMEGKK